ncbi:MAG: hypothetical protein PHQ27_02675, partial [Victivallales bacterium]|nr:hypothetical protein [Victivallales bacterium]
MTEYSPQHLGIILEHYTDATENIIRREIELLEQMGYSLRIFILNPPAEPDVPPLGFHAELYCVPHAAFRLLVTAAAALPRLLWRHPRGLSAGLLS